MLGLGGEYLAERLIDNMKSFLQVKETAISTAFESNLHGKSLISQKYTEYEKILVDVQKEKDTHGNFKYPVLQSLKPELDVAAKSIYSTYLRLTRNEMAHPAGVIMDRIESLIMLISFVKYSEIQHKCLEFYIANS